MKKRQLHAAIEAANQGHKIKLFYYWVKEAYLIRLVDDHGKKLPKAYALVTDDDSDPTGDAERLTKIIQIRDNVEKITGKPKKSDPWEGLKEIDDDDPDLDVNMDCQAFEELDQDRESFFNKIPKFDELVPGMPEHDNKKGEYVRKPKAKQSQARKA